MSNAQHGTPLHEVFMSYYTYGGNHFQHPTKLKDSLERVFAASFSLAVFSVISRLTQSTYLITSYLF